MFTFPIESSYVNAAVYVLFDVLLVVILAANFSTIQSANVLHRVSSGQRVKIRESPLRHIAGHIKADGTKLWLLLSLIQLLVLFLLFVATLGINGRTEYTEVLISQRYISKLPLDDQSFNRKRASPLLFSSCTSSDGNGFNYFPAAFDIIGNASIAKFEEFKDKDGNYVQVNSVSVVRQNTTGFTPMLRVFRCGRGIADCSNYNKSSETEALLIGNSQAENISSVSGGEQKRWGFWSALQIPAGILSESAYNHLICSTHGVAPTPDGRFTYLCTAEAFDADQMRYTFRVGKIEFQQDELAAVHDRDNSNVTLTVLFTAFSTEAEIEFDLSIGGTVFYYALSRLYFTPCQN